MAALTAKERVTAALVEAGYPNALVNGTPDSPQVTIYNALDPSTAVPNEVAWRAFVVCTPEWVPCLACWAFFPWFSCRAIGAGALDCGIDRP
jgi:hypothetical protein